MEESGGSFLSRSRAALRRRIGLPTPVSSASHAGRLIAGVTGGTWDCPGEPVEDDV
jgi:hypothetical protein